MRKGTINTMNIFFELKEKYGIKYASIAFLLPFIVAIGFVLMWIAISFCLKIYDNNHNFLLDNENKFIIYDNDVSSKRVLYYELDFEKNKIIYRKDSNEWKRDYQHTVDDKNYKEIYNIIQNVKKDNNNLLEITEDERINFFRNNVYDFYVIKDSYGNLYYIKDAGIAKTLTNLLKISNVRFFDI